MLRKCFNQRSLLLHSTDVETHADALLHDVKMLNNSAFFSFFPTGRREFVQRLKLEATLNVHNGCVSARSFVFLTLFCTSSYKHANVTFPQEAVWGLGVWRESRSLTSGQVVYACEKPEADSHTSCHSIGLDTARPQKQPQQTRPRRAAI